ncbi:MAG: glycosyltransferase [bacterium]|nr:glycosyltransferase [bacterium]
MYRPPFSVSIIVTSYNYARFLKRAIDSAAAQRLPGLEIVVVDNASTDESWQIIEAAASQDQRIRPFRNERNLGMIGNHVRGLEVSRGERVVFLSADDELLPGHLELLVGAHIAHPELDYVFSSYVKIDDVGKFIGFFGHPGHPRGSYMGGRNEFADLLTYDCYACFPTTLFRREELLAAGGFPEGITAGDLDTYLRLASQGSAFGFIATPTVAVRVHPDEASGQERYVATGRQVLDHLAIMERHVTDANRPLLEGRERGAARLLNAKINNLRAHPERFRELEAEIAERSNAIGERLAGPTRRSVARPAISVILPLGDDVAAAFEALDTYTSQGFDDGELIIVANSAEDYDALFRSRVPNERVRSIRHRRPLGQAQTLNDALKLANGELVTYLAPNVRWPLGHLERLSSVFRGHPEIGTLVVPASLTALRAVDGSCVPVATFDGFAGEPILQQTGHIGEGAPLVTLAHRRSLLDVTGTFDEGIPHAIELDFVTRLLNAAPVGSDDRLPIEIRHMVDAHHAALVDPNGYLASLQAIYRGRPVDAENVERRRAHLATMLDALSQMNERRAGGYHFHTHFLARGPVEQRPRERRATPRILIVDDRVPYEELGRGYPRARKMAEVLQDAGWDVTLYPLNTPFDEPPFTGGVDGCTILYGRGRELLASTLAAELPTLDVLFVSRPHNMRDVRRALGTIPAMRPWALVYDAEAVYALRAAIQSAVEQTPVDEALFRSQLADELALTDGCDAVVAVSQAEAETIARRFTGPVGVVSFSIPVREDAAAPEHRNGMLFVGAIDREGPNEDALYWFLDSVFPTLRARGVAPIRHAGVMKSERIRALDDNGIELFGPVPDLRAMYDGARMFLAPTRFAAGLPQKVYEAAAHGLPCIVTPLIAEQLRWQHERETLVAETSDEWIAACERLAHDDTLWRALSTNALDATRRAVSPGEFRQRLLGVVEDAARRRAHIAAS